MTEDAKPRRRFLQALAIVPASTMAVGALTTACTSADEGKAAQAAKPYAPTYFTPPEWTFIVAAVDHLIPADEYGPGAIAAGVPEFIDRQMETPFGHGKLWYMQGPFHPDQVPELGYQLNQTPREVYRHGIEACNAWCVKTHGKVYAELDKPLQEQILKDLQGGKIELETVPARTFFSFLLSNTKEGFFADPIYGGNKNMVGWKMVGFPGARADYMDWVDQPNVKYPYGPVSISGEKG
ncbi:gluconate 2-dehydrogenase subunit 3 family protein [Achromobacter marplatensis]|uniref:Gluconate 2-dehydrogenase subunit 3 family protein n=1 Tax=Achromobacter marplatensis TaxID=470868 RepID=A0AA42W8H6_9BURK|nr:gluconate 2-dehydrogenase subunit 3 family protein [Achromobacter marplatensis]MDH2049711.1 gluconate 2-dehydrogenase subunit 3 family protein [Achromobacter marplatensis]